MPSPETRADQIESGLSGLARRLSPTGERVAGVARLTAGATQELWRFDLIDRDGMLSPLILRRAPGGERVSTQAAGMEVEAALLKVAATGGVPVPAVRHVLAPEDGLGHGFVMDRLEGETLGGRIARAEALAGVRDTLARQCGEILARIHALPLDALPALRTQTPDDLIETWEGLYRASGLARPVFDLALRRLEATRPPPVAPALIHGDFRNGNLIVGPEGVRAVLDWELAHLGDPREDLGWLCVPSWRFRRIDRPVGGFGAREDLYAGYAAAGGGPVDIEAMRWWELFGVLRWGVMCAGMVAAFRSEDPSVERAVIARRASETEVDLMRMLDA